MPNELTWIDSWGLGIYNTTPKIDGFQKHHIIPQQLKNHALLKEAGINIHSIKNIIYLPTSADAHPTRTIHKGSHPEYKDNIKKKMNKILENGKNNKWTQKEYKNALRELIRSERANLHSGKTILNKNSIRAKGY